MIGVPYRLVRTTEEGVADKVVSLGTRRSGEAGKSMKKAARQYSKLQFQVGKAYSQYEYLSRCVDELPVDSVEVDSFVEKRDKKMDEFQDLTEQWNDAGEILVKKSLSAAGYPNSDVEGIMDQLTESDLHDMVVTVQMGEQPQDFFIRRERREKQTSTSQPGGSQQESSSSTATPERKSKKGKSD